MPRIGVVSWCVMLRLQMPSSCIWVPVQVTVTPWFWPCFLRIQIADSRGWPKCVVPGWWSWFLDSAWPSPGCCRHLGNGLVDQSSFSCSLCLSVSYPSHHSVFKIKQILFLKMICEAAIVYNVLIHLSSRMMDLWLILKDFSIVKV